MKKCLSFILGVIICLSFSGCANTFEKEKAALNGTKWFSAVETSNSVVVWDFFEESLQCSKYFFDGNGIHESDKNVAEYELEKDVIKAKFEDNEILIPYTFENDEIHLEKGKYFSVQDIEDGIQGCWTFHKKDYISSIRMSTENEYNIQFNAGTMINESAGRAYTGEGYYYYGPNEGTYTIGNGKFETEAKHGGEFFFNVYEGKVNLYHYGDRMTPSDGLPGEDGYVFD